MATRLAAVIFDCDGVLLVSNRLKVRVFADAARSAGFTERDVAAFSRHVASNFGTSRIRMFEALLAREDLEHRPATSVEALVSSYAEQLYRKYVRCPTTPGMVGTLEALAASATPLFIVSGSDQAELRQLMSERGLARHFRSIFGSPKSKSDNIRTILADIGLKSGGGGRVVFVGDAEADWRAASDTQARFVYMDKYSTAKPRMRTLASEHGFEQIADLRALPSLLTQADAA